MRAKVAKFIRKNAIETTIGQPFAVYQYKHVAKKLKRTGEVYPNGLPVLVEVDKHTIRLVPGCTRWLIGTMKKYCRMHKGINKIALIKRARIEYDAARAIKPA